MEIIGHELREAEEAEALNMHTAFREGHPLHPQSPPDPSGKITVAFKLTLF